MRKWFVFVIAASLMVGFGSCGKASPPAPTSAPSAETTQSAPAQPATSPPKAGTDDTRPSPPETRSETPQPAVPKPNAAAAKVKVTKGIFLETCTRCHAVTRIEQYQGSAPWKVIVDRMVREHGAKAGPENAAKIVAYLEQTYGKK